MKHIFSILLGLLIGCGSASALAAAQRGEIVVDGKARSYVLHVPATLQQLAPLVLVLHGFGGDGANVLEQTGWAAKADAEGFVVVAPDGLPEHVDHAVNFLRNPRTWNSGDFAGTPAQRSNADDVHFLRALVDELQQRLKLDQRRLFVTGFSNGAAMAFRAAVEMSDRVAAVAPVSNALLSKAEPLARPVSLLLIWGDADPLNPYRGGPVKRAGVTLVRPSAYETWSLWRGLLHCADEAPSENLNPKVLRRAARGCDGGAAAEFVSIEGLGHQWPGGKVILRLVAGPGSDALDATSLIWNFFLAHPAAALPK